MLYLYILLFKKYIYRLDNRSKFVVRPWLLTKLFDPRATKATFTRFILENQSVCVYKILRTLQKTDGYTLHLFTCVILKGLNE